MVGKARSLTGCSLPEVRLVGGGEGDMVPDDLPVDTTARIELCVLWAMVDKTRPLTGCSLPEIRLVGGGERRDLLPGFNLPEVGLVGGGEGQARPLTRVKLTGSTACRRWGKARSLTRVPLTEVGLVGGGEGDVVPNDIPVEAAGKNDIILHRTARMELRAICMGCGKNETSYRVQRSSGRDYSTYRTV